MYGVAALPRNQLAYELCCCIHQYVLVMPALVCEHPGILRETAGLRCRLVCPGRILLPTTQCSSSVQHCRATVGPDLLTETSGRRMLLNDLSVLLKEPQTLTDHIATTGRPGTAVLQYTAVRIYTQRNLR